jgi:hypothetical protein
MAERVSERMSERESERGEGEREREREREALLRDIAYTSINLLNVTVLAR